MNQNPNDLKNKNIEPGDEEDEWVLFDDSILHLIEIAKGAYSESDSKNEDEAAADIGKLQPNEDDIENNRKDT